MRLEYDPRGDIAYIGLRDDPEVRVHHTERLGADDEYERGIDYAADGTIVGYEFMNASRGLDLDGLPHAADIAAFIANVQRLTVVADAS